MKCANRFSIAIAVLFIAVAVTGVSAAVGQQFTCYATPDTTDALTNAGQVAPYALGADLRAVNLAIHVLRETSGTGGYGQASIDSLLSRLSGDFATTGILFDLVGQFYVDNSAYLSSPVDSAAVLFSSYSDSMRIDIFLGENFGPVSGTTAGIPSSALVLTGAACGTSALSHFVGHCLGLYETNETAFGVEQEDGSNSAEAGDLVIDTSVVPDPDNILEGNELGSWNEFTAEQGRRMAAGILSVPELAKLEHDTGITYHDGSSQTNMAGQYTGVPTNATAVDLDVSGKLDLVINASSSAFVSGAVNPTTGVPSFANSTSTEFPGMASFMAASKGAIAADYDNDGDLDLYVPNTTQHKLLRNGGTGVYADVTSASGLLAGQTAWAQSISGSWGDYDADGFVDLLVLAKNQTAGVEGSGYVRLLHNNQDGTFSDDTRSSVGISGCTTDVISALWADFNKDNFIDLLLVQTGPYTQRGGAGTDGDKSRMFISNGNGTFANATDTNLEDEGDWKFDNANAGILDVEPDGDLDVVFANVDGTGYYKNVANTICYGWKGQFFASGFLRDPIDLDVCDYNLDGLPDYMYNDPDENPISNVNFRPEFGPTPTQFTSENQDWTGSPHATGGIAVADFDQNGTVDVFASRASSGYFYYYPHPDTGAHFGNWIGVRLRSFAAVCNRFGIGATVVVSHGSYHQAQVVDGGSGRAGQSPLDLVFGLGDYSGPVDIKVYWSDGHTIQEYTGATSGQYHTLGQYAIAPSSIGFTKIYDPYLAMYTWEFTWDTDIMTDVAGDRVTVTPPATPSECTGSEFSLSTANSNVSVNIAKVNNKYRHTLTMTGGTCTEGCRYSYTVKSSLLGVDSPDVAAKTFKTLSCVAIP